MSKILVVRANLGGFDKPQIDEQQSIDCDFITYTDDNYPPRRWSMTSRMQAKIPKCFAWQMKPGYNFYLWVDGNIRLSNSGSVKYFYDQCQDYDIVVLKHPLRDTVHWEGRYIWRGLHSNAPSNYMKVRYENEHLEDQMAAIKADKNFIDDLLVNGGIFMYRNTPEVQQVLKEWWYNISRYLIEDQPSFAYVLKKSGLRVNVLSDVFDNCPWLESMRHAK